MSKYPLRGEGLEVRRNTAEDGPDRRKYTLVVDDHLFVELKNSFAQMLRDQASSAGAGTDAQAASSAWTADPRTRRWTFSYEVADEAFEAAAADDHCPEPEDEDGDGG